MNPLDKLATFNIPVSIKHDHSEESMQLMQEGIARVNHLLQGLHEGCVEHVIKYAELNIRAFFLFHLADKETLKEAVMLFIHNLHVLFLKNENTGSAGGYSELINGNND